MYSARLFIDSHAPVVPRVLHVFAWLDLNGLKPLRTEHAFSPTGMWLTIVFADRADAQALAEKFEGEVVLGTPPA